MSVRRASLRTPEEQVEGEWEAHPSRRNSATSTSWENARYKRHSGSNASLNSSTTAVGSQIPQRPHSSRTHTAPSVRPSLKGRAPSSQRIAYHFRNGSTGHLHHTQSYHYRDKNYPPYQHHYRKIASSSQTSVIRTSMYGQYGWYNYNSDSRKNSVVSLDRQSVYGQPNVSQSRQSLDSQSAYEKEQERRSWYKRDSQGGDMSRRATVAAPPPTNINTNDNGNTPRKAATLKKPPPSPHDRSASSTSHRSSRPLPPEPPTLPPPDLNPGWPPRGWHVYVSAMTQDYLYGGSGTTSAHRPALEDYVFDQDTLTFVRRPQDDADLTLSPTSDNDGHDKVNGWDAHAEDDIPQAYAYEPSPGPGPRGRATQSLDIPREHAKFDFPFNAPPVPPLPADSSKAARRLSKKPPSKKSKSASSKGTTSPDTLANGAAPELSPTTVDSNGIAESSHNNQSTISLVSKKSTKSSKSKKEGNGGWFPWGRKRSKSVNGRDGEDDGAPPVPDLPPHLRTDMFPTSTAGSADGHVAALCDVSVKHDWALNAIDPSNPDGRASANSEVIASEPEGSQGSGQFTPTESETSLSAQTQLNFSTKDKRASRLAEASPPSSTPVDCSPYPSPPSSATGHNPRSISHSRASSNSAVPTSQSTSPSHKVSPAPSRASTIIAPSNMNGRNSRRNSTNMKGGAYILDTLEGSRITSPYPEPQSTVIRRMSNANGSRSNIGRSESRVSVVTALPDDATYTTAMTPRSGSSVDLSHSRPMSALSSTTAAPPGSAMASSVDLHSRPMSAMSLATTTTAIATPLQSIVGSSARGKSLDMGSSRPMSSMSSVTATTTARSYSPFPSFSYVPPDSTTCGSEYSVSEQSTPAKSPLGQGGHSRAASSPASPHYHKGTYYSASPSPSPSSPPATPQTPTKPKGWKRWTTLSGSPKKVGSAGTTSKAASSSKVDVSKVRSASMDVRVASPIEYGTAVKGGDVNGKAGQEGVVGEGALIWSAPTNAKVPPSPSKLRKKRKV